MRIVFEAILWSVPYSLIMPLFDKNDDQDYKKEFFKMLVISFPLYLSIRFIVELLW